jgi:phosphonate transport system ATP-binding protein
LAPAENLVTPVLQAQGLAKSIDGRRILSDASVSVSPGEFVAVLGASGSGKTTLFRCLSRLVEPDTGTIQVLGQPFESLRGTELAAARQHIGIVFQQFNLIRRRSVLDNVLAGRLRDVSIWRVVTRRFPRADLSRAREALQAVGLKEHALQRADRLSGGQQQRVALARAIAQESRVLLADEPVASLDPETAIAVMTLIASLCRSRDIGVLCTLHQPDLARRFADRTLTMVDGRLS